MANQAFLERLKQKISLTAAISTLLTLVAIFPLLITVTSSQLLSRPQLISQLANAMAQDTHTRVQLIDTYLLDRQRDVEIVSHLFSLQEYVQGNHAFKQQVLNALAVGVQNDVNYDTWSLLDLQGNALLWYPTQPKVHGNSLIPPNILNQIQRLTRPLFSGVFYQSDVGEASIVVYMPIMEYGSKVVGILRAEFALTYIWNVVNSQTDSVGSYAFILDQRGVRIAYTADSTHGQPAYLFKAIAPLSPSDQRLVATEDLYGDNGKPTPVLSDISLSRVQSDPHTPSKFEIVPVGQQETFEVIRVDILAISWTYFALRPLKSIIAIADQQLFNTLLIAAVVLILALIIGVITGRRITVPILRSMEQQEHLNQLKDEILQNVSHELRTPLTQVYGYLELLMTCKDQVDSTTEMLFLKRAIHGCEELQLLINDVLETVSTDGQPQQPCLQDVSVAQVVKDVLELFDPHILQNYDLQIAIPETLIARADLQYLRRVLRNLLSNAFKYTPPQTALVVDATPAMNTPAGIPSSPSVCIRVKDNGPGIPPNDIPLLFEKFGRLKRDLSSSTRGVGLGLYICKQLVEAMGGHIWVESLGLAGQGSQFCFTLPLVTHPAHMKSV